MIRVQTGAGAQVVSRAHIHTSTGTRRILRARHYDGTTTNIVAAFFPAMTLAASPAAVLGVGFDDFFSAVTTAAVTLTPTGGTAPYAYSYSITTPPSYGVVSVDSPASATTTFTHDGVTAGDIRTATATATVTDALGLTASTTIALSFRCRPPR